MLRTHVSKIVESFVRNELNCFFEYLFKLNKMYAEIRWNDQTIDLSILTFKETRDLETRVLNIAVLIVLSLSPASQHVYLSVLINFSNIYRKNCKTAFYRSLEFVVLIIRERPGIRNSFVLVRNYFLFMCSFIQRGFIWKLSNLL